MIIPDSSFYCLLKNSPPVGLFVDIVKVDPQAFQKNQKRHFFKVIEKSFQEITPIGPESHQFSSF